jgi:hypothetical protein
MSKRIHPHLPQNDYDLTAGGLTVLPSTASYAHDQKYSLEIRFRTLLSFKILIHDNIRISKKMDFPLDFIPNLSHIASQICMQHD